jgi:hypothetical protein
MTTYMHVSCVDAHPRQYTQAASELVRCVTYCWLLLLLLLLLLQLHQHDVARYFDADVDMLLHKTTA